MKSPLGSLGTLVNRAPVSYAPRRQGFAGFNFGKRGDDREAQLAAMGSVGTLFSIVSTLASATSQVGWKLYRTAKSGNPDDRVEVTSHAALDLWRKPNPFYTGQELVETSQQHLDLTGEAWWVIARDPRASIPLELWPVRPDRMAPVPHPTDFLAGYVYTSPDGEKVPLGLDEVIQIRVPSPLDPYRGMGPVQSILVDLDSARYSAEWNRNFFINSAEPGGIIQVDKRLSDGEWDEITTRWREQHQGVANAHRVAVIEQGQWVNRTFTMRDMQFSELRGVSREIIREAYGIHTHMLGGSDTVNRANADAAETTFARWKTTPRLERYKRALNADLLPLFGSTTRGLEFDFEDPTPQDAEALDRERVSKAQAAYQLVQANFNGDTVREALDLPEVLVWEKPAPPPAPVLPAETPPGPVPTPPAPEAQRRRAPRNAADLPPEQLPDVSHMAATQQQALDDLMAEWATLTAAQREQLADAVKEIVAAGTLAGLASLAVSSVGTAAALKVAMVAISAAAAAGVVTEAAAQGVTIGAGTASAATLEQAADVVAGLLASEMAVAAGRSAMTEVAAGRSADAVAAAVRFDLEQLSNASARKQLGGALHGAANAGRLETLRHAPEGSIYASGVNDKNQCGPCHEIDGRFLGLTSQMAQVERTFPAGAYGGYIDCLGGINCRCSPTGVWRPEQVGEQ